MLKDDIIFNKSQAMKGRAGESGPRGVDGIPGPMGMPGPMGIQGPQGDEGPIGYTGSIVNVSAQGFKGITGATGPTGPQGPDGIRPIGIQGDKGAVGPKGDTGPEGDRGATGATGYFLSIIDYGMFTNDRYERYELTDNNRYIIDFDNYTAKEGSGIYLNNHTDGGSLTDADLFAATTYVCIRQQQNRDVITLTKKGIYQISYSMSLMTRISTPTNRDARLGIYVEHALIEGDPTVHCGDIINSFYGVRFGSDSGSCTFETQQENRRVFIEIHKGPNDNGSFDMDIYKATVLINLLIET